MTVYRVIRTSKAVITRTFYLDESVAQPTGDVDVQVTRQDGTVVQDATAAEDDDGGFAFTFQGSDVLDDLDVTWTATIGGDAIVLDQDLIQVVGGFYLSLAEARAVDAKFSDVNRYPLQTLVEKRIELEDEFERITGQAFVPRFARDVLSGDGRRALKLAWPWLRRVRAITVGGAALDQATVDAFGADPLGVLRRDAGWTAGTGNIVVEYEHGMDRPPAGIHRVAKLRMKSLLLNLQSPLTDRAERVTSAEGRTVSVAIPTEDSTGIPDVDAELGRHPGPRPGFG